jgi:hypothetical protein
MFVALYPQLDSINIMRLATPQSAILLAVVISKALIIIALIPREPADVRHSSTALRRSGCGFLGAESQRPRAQPCSRRSVGMTT